MTTRRVFLSLLTRSVAVVAVGCEEHRAPAPAPTTSVTASATAAAGSATVTVRFDDEAQDVVLGAVPRSLSSVLPEALRDPKTWRELVAKSVDGKRTMGIRRFADKYRDHDVRLYIDPKGRPSVGIFRKTRPDMPAHVLAKLGKPHIALVDAAFVEVRTKELPPQAIERPQVVVALDGTETVLDEKKLNALEKHKSPASAGSKGRRKRKGWRLVDVVSTVTDPKTVAHIKLVTDEQDSLMVRGASLGQEGFVGLLRYNNRGQLGLTVHDAKTPVPRRIRGITKIIVASK